MCIIKKSINIQVLSCNWLGPYSEHYAMLHIEKNIRAR